MQIHDEPQPGHGEAAPAKMAALTAIRDQFGGTNGKSQCQRLLAALAQFPITTFEAMRFLDVYHCPARVLQLRKAGHDIATYWQTVVTESGTQHRVGLYVLQRGAGRA